MKINTFKVCVECLTFNHAQYIEDCMNGFTMQQTDFPYVCCILDDASTDGEPDVIRKYLQGNFDMENDSVARNEETADYVFCFAQHKTNKNCYFAVYFLKYNHYKIKKNKRQYIEERYNNAKYVACCEGDDYWTEPLKLQKQVEFLEHHPDYVLVHSDFSILREKKIRHNGSRNYKIYEGNVTNTLFHGCWIRTLTICYRNIDYNLDVKYPHGMFKGDIFIFYLLSLKGKFHFHNEETGVYRIHNDSFSHPNSEEKRWKFNESLKILDYFMADQLNVGSEIKSELDNKWFIKEFKHSVLASDYSYYKRIIVPHKLECSQTIALQYEIARIRPFFYCMSYYIKYIRFFKAIVKRFFNR